MPVELSEDLAVDVLIVGGGIQAHYLARQLVDRYSVCVLSDPSVREETLDTEGYFSAGYEGNDANRIQPARRAAGYWKLWSESHGVVHDESETYFTVGPDDLVTRPRLWSDASLVFQQATDLPSVFGGGSISDHVAFRTVNDVVVSPSAVLAQLRQGIEHCFIQGKVVKVGLANDRAIEFIDVEIDGATIPIVPRYTVFAASGANAGLIAKVAVRFRDVAKRKERTEQAKASQAVRRRYDLCIRGDLPLVSGHFGGFQVTSHRLVGTSDVIWIVNPPIDDALTTLGVDDLRFDVPVDSKVVASVVRILFGMSPAIERGAHRFRWSVYGRRRTEHPMMAVRQSSKVGQPAPAKIDNFGLDSFMALWPSHSSYAMIVGDVATERIAEALGARGDFGLAVSPAELADATPAPPQARWEEPSFPWHSWDTFAADHSIA